MSPGSEGCLRGPAGFDTIHPQSPVVTGEVCAPTNLVFFTYVRARLTRDTRVYFIAPPSVCAPRNNENEYKGTPLVIFAFSGTA